MARSKKSTKTTKTHKRTYTRHQPQVEVTAVAVVGISPEPRPVEVDAAIVARLADVQDLVAARQRVLLVSRRDAELQALLARTEGEHRAVSVLVDAGVARREALAQLVVTIRSELDPEVG